MYITEQNMHTCSNLAFFRKWKCTHAGERAFWETRITPTRLMLFNYISRIETIVQQKYRMIFLDFWVLGSDESTPSVFRISFERCQVKGSSRQPVFRSRLSANRRSTLRPFHFGSCNSYLDAARECKQPRSSIPPKGHSCTLSMLNAEWSLVTLDY